MEEGLYGDELDEDEDDLDEDEMSPDEEEIIKKMQGTTKVDKKSKDKDIQGFEKGGNLDKQLKSAKQNAKKNQAAEAVEDDDSEDDEDFEEEESEDDMEDLDLDAEDAHE